MRINLILAWLLMFTVNVFAQGNSVTGSVFSSEDNEPLIGATVKVKGENNAVATDIDGRFTLKGVGPNAKHLEISYVGYQSQTVEIKPDLKIYLHPATEMLDEMIVVAFGKQKRESFTGSASVVGAEQIARQQVTNPIEALNGTVTGLTMTETNSFTSDPSITIRGIGSLNAGTEPLIVLDGMPYNGYWNDLNPADIASMTVLKDASANALYGARGANGVILITSKNAERGRTKVSFNAKWGSNHDGRVKYDVITDPGQYYEAFYLAQKNYYMNIFGEGESLAHLHANQMLAANPADGGLGYMVYTIPEGQQLIGTNGRLNPNATLGNRVANNGEIYTIYPDDWFKEGLRDGFRQEYNVTLTSANDKYSMYASLGYLDANSIAYGNDIERYTARLKADVQAFSWLKVGGSASYNHTATNSQGGVFGVLTSVAPIYPLYLRDAAGNIMTDQNGKMFDYGDGRVIGLDRAPEQAGNPIQEDLLDISKNVSNAFNIQGFATIDFLSDFHFTVNASVYDTENRINTGYNPYYGFNTGRGYVSTGQYRTASFNTQQLLNYSKNFGKNSLDVLLGHEYTNDVGARVFASRNNPAMYDSNKEISGAIIDASMSGYDSQYNVEGWFLRAQYDYDNKYFASGSFRRDGSSRFHPDHRWGNFWSVGAAWILTKEDWMPQSNLVNMLKFKASYGEQGNDAIDDFLYTDIYDIKNSNDEVSFSFSSKGNPLITWEKVGNFNTGFEFDLFNNRLSGGIEYYWRKTSDMLMYFTAPYEVGYAGYYDNIGDMVNQGIELDLSADIIAVKNFNWNVGLNLTWEKNRVTRLPAEKAVTVVDGYHGYINGSNFIGEGLPVYTWYIKKFAGVGESGEALYYKKDSDGNISTTQYFDEASYFTAGTSLPDVFGGFNTSIKIFDFDIAATFNYSIGGKKIDYGYQYLMRAPYPSMTGFGLHRDVFDCWTPENTDSQIPLWYFGNTETGLLTDQWLTNASYLTFRNLSIGYTLPKAISRKMKMEKLRVYATCENLAYWTKRRGFDPRTSFKQGNYAGYSPMRTISGGLQIEF